MGDKSGHSGPLGVPWPLHHVVDHLQDLVLKTDSVKVMLDELAHGFGAPDPPP
jgi:hypothetical protein